MATAAQPIIESNQPGWLWRFLREELSPYPGRTATVIRMVAAASVVMVLIMAYHIPQAATGAYVVFITSRESLRATLRSGLVSTITYSAGVVVVILGVQLVLSSPILHFLWIVVSLFMLFFVIRTMTDYGAAAGFGFLITIGISLFDRRVTPELNVEATMWTAYAVALASLVTIVIEVVFRQIQPVDDLVDPLNDRLRVAGDLLLSYAAGNAIEKQTETKLLQYAMTGTSRLRNVLLRSHYQEDHRNRMSTIVALAGRLIDMASTLSEVKPQPDKQDRERMKILAERLQRIRQDLKSRYCPPASEQDNSFQPSEGVPLLPELERTVTLILQALAGSGPGQEYLPSVLEDSQGNRVFREDTFSNPEHLKFALKGCLAGMLCYIIYTSIDWPGISTALATCLITGLSTVGSSRQKQLLRISGALVGGVVFGMGAQIFILPYIDTLPEFLVLFVVVTAISAWFITASPRLSYFGLQLALAFYLINLQEFTIQTSLAVARDRVVGVLLGLIMMWVVFDQIWVTRASTEMRRVFVLNLRLLAQLAHEPAGNDPKQTLVRIRSLRAKISSNFDAVNAHSDAVLLEFGPSAKQDLAWRSAIRKWQPQLRALFLMQIALLQYGFQTRADQKIKGAEMECGEETAQILEAMAKTLEQKNTGADEAQPADLLNRLEQQAKTGNAETESASTEGLVALAQQGRALSISLYKDIENFPQLNNLSTVTGNS